MATDREAEHLQLTTSKNGLIARKINLLTTVETEITDIVGNCRIVRFGNNVKYLRMNLDTTSDRKGRNCV